MTYWDDIHHHDPDEIWMSNSRVRQRINERITGNAGSWPLDWFKEKVGPQALPLANVLSIGCGVGSLERDLVRRNIAEAVVGIDTAAAPLKIARDSATREGIGDRITYLEVDANEYLKHQTGLDAIFFHASLHHFRDPGDLLKKCARALSHDGLLYIDEYVGPSRHQWRIRWLAALNCIYYLLPSSVRRVRTIRKPVNRADPSEAVASDEIVRAVDENFTVLHRADYGGNLLSVIYPNLQLRPKSPAATRDLDAAIEFLLEVEDVLLRHPLIEGSRSYYSVMIGKPRPERSAATTRGAIAEARSISSSVV